MARWQTCGMIALIFIIFVVSAGCIQSPVSTNAGIPGATPTFTQITVGTTAAQTPAPVLVRLETTMGNITIALDQDMPITAGNFETLVNKGFYNGVIFHRVINGFVIQGGDPTGTGRGGPGYTIPDEFTNHNKNVRGTVAMANAGPNTGGSQFFINLVDNSLRPDFDTSYPVFGKLVEGMDVVDAIGKVPTSGDPDNRPLANVTIIRAEML